MNSISRKLRKFLGVNHKSQWSQKDLSVRDRILVATGAIASMRSRYANITNLWDTEIRVFSQWGEDGILTYLLDSLEIWKPKIIEIGAGNFEECNSRFQAEFRNASVYAVDSRSDLKPHVESLEIYWRNTIFPINDHVTPDNVNSHLNVARHNLGGLDVFSLDVDGNDFWILQSANLEGISIVVCEYNPVFGDSSSITVPRDDYFSREDKHYSYLYYGMSLRACIELLSSKGYVFCGANLAGNNAFFIESNLIDRIKLVIPDPSNLSKFIDWRVRESRNEIGEMSYLTGNEQKKLIGNLKVYDLKKSSLVSLSAVI